MDSVIVLAMHGAPPRDFPSAELHEFFGLHARHEASGGQTPPAMAERYHDLEARLRDWPRTEGNDPFWAGSMALAKALRQASGHPVEVGFNEFCSPDVGTAMDAAIAAGAKRLMVVTPMMTHGGDHSEVDIPGAIAEARLRHPEVAFDYIWPFPLEDIAAFLVTQLERHLREA